MVKSPPAALGDFHAISGVGEGRVKQYGEAFLALLLNRQAENGEAGK